MTSTRTRLSARGGLCLLGVLVACVLVLSGCGKQGSHPDATLVAQSVENPPQPATSQPATLAATPIPRAAQQPLPPPSKSDLAHSWTLPKLDGVDNNDAEVVQLAINDGATRILAKSKKAIYTFDLAAGTVVQTFRPAPTKWNRNPVTERMFISPDAGLVATWADAPEGVKGAEPSFTFQDADTGTVLSTAKLERDFSIDFNTAAFSPQGKTLFLPGRTRDKLCVLALSAAEGSRHLLELPALGELNGIMRSLMPLPARAAFLVCWSNDRAAGVHPSTLSILDLDRHTEEPLQSIDIEPLNGSYDRRIEISADGALVLAQDSGQHHVGTVELGDLQGQSVRMRHSDRDVSFPCACFTPDGARFVIEWGPHFEIMHFGRPANLPQRERVPPKLQLYDVATQRILAEYILPTAARTLVLSGNGTTLAWSHADQLYTVDFQSAFGLAPLAPLTRNADPVFTSR